MTASEDHSPGDEYFNTLSKQAAKQDEERDEQRRASQDRLPKPKRIACVLCRKRKLKCDGNKPACGTCTRLRHDCLYDEVRRKSGPKRGYLKALEARLAQVETLLKTHDGDILGAGKRISKQTLSTDALLHGNVARQGTPLVASVGNSNPNVLPSFDQPTTTQDSSAEAHDPAAALGNDASGVNLTREDSLQWQMIGQGLDEPLPTQDVTAELDQGYFEKIHPSLPILHRPRYYAAMNLAPHMRPPVCLRYAMWANAAAVMGKYEALQEHFYARARKYIQRDEMRGHGESIITVAHVQTWTLLATYEFKLMFFPRAWMSSGRACRLAQMMGLHRLDGVGLDVKQCLPPPKDWTEREERRRTFWICFCVDRYASIGTGWPMTIEERDIRSNLPGDEESYEAGKPSKTMTLIEALEPQGAPKLSSFAGVVVMACLFGRNLLHLHRTSPNDRDDDLNGEFWTRHRQIDSILHNTALALPDALRMPCGLSNANVVFMNMNIHTSTICLHQAAIFKADKNRMPVRISAESKIRCITAAAEIANIMRQISHLDMSAMNPFISFCLYVAARVFVQYMKFRPDDSQIKASLQFLLSAMHAIKRKNPLTDSFLVQLDVDLEAAGLEDSRTMRLHIVKQPDTRIQAEGCALSHIGLRPIGRDTNGNGEQPGSSAGSHTQRNRSTHDDNRPENYKNQSQNTDTEPDPSSANGRCQQQHQNMDDYLIQTPQFDLPQRQRSPGFSAGSNPGAPKSPLGCGECMDTSPDNNSSNDSLTPGSGYSTQPGHKYVSPNTSVNDMSPPIQQKPGIAISETQWTNGFGGAGSTPIEYMNVGVHTAECIDTDFNSHDF